MVEGIRTKKMVADPETSQYVKLMFECIPSRKRLLVTLHGTLRNRTSTRWIPKGELLLTIMSSLAQEESRNISENVTWGQRKRFADGKVSMPYKHFLGYRKGENGEPEVVPEEAEIVRRIYGLFLKGQNALRNQDDP